MSSKVEITFIPPVGKRQTIELDACIVGGVMGDSSKAPMGAYFGNLTFESTTITMIHIARSFIKCAEEQLIIMAENKEPIITDREKQLKAIKNMMLNIVDKAFEIEKRNADEDNVDLETHMVKMRYDKRS